MTFRLQVKHGPVKYLPPKSESKLIVDWDSFYILTGCKRWPVHHFMMMRKYHMEMDVVAAVLEAVF